MLILVGVVITIALNGGLFNYSHNAVLQTQMELYKENDVDKGKVTVGNDTYETLRDYVGGINYGQYTKDTIPKGADLTIGTEKFKVLSNSNGILKAIPYYNLVLTSNPIKQATDQTASTAGTSAFSSSRYWGDGINTNRIDMTNQANYIQQYISSYQNTLEGLGAEGIIVKAIRKSEVIQSGVTAANKNPSSTGNYWLGSGRAYGAFWVQGSTVITSETGVGYSISDTIRSTSNVSNCIGL